MKKRILAMLIALSMVFSLLPTTLVSFATDETIDSTYWVHEDNVDSSFADGTGTESDPYQIATAAQLALLSQKIGQAWSYAVDDEIKAYASAYYVLIADIDLAGKEWVPIQGQYRGYDFSGSFDGQGYKISNLTITKSVDAQGSDNVYAGLFGSISSGAVVQNIEFVDVRITKDDSINQYAGAVAGMVNNNAVIIRNITVTSGTIEGGQYVGGIAGYGNALIYNCVNYASITNEGSYSGIGTYGDMYLGGVVGHSYASAGVYNCSNYGSITMNVVELEGYYRSAYVGGIVGYSNYGVQNSANLGAVTVTLSGDEWANGSCYRIGGILGDGDIAINCYNQGAVSYVENATNSYNLAPYLGGIGGIVDEVYNCYNTGITSTNAAIAGGYEENEPDIIENCFWLSGQNAYGSTTSWYDTMAITSCGTFTESSGTLTAVSGNVLLKDTLVEALNAWSKTGYLSGIWQGSGTAVSFVDPVSVSGTIGSSAGAVSGAVVSINGLTATTNSDGVYTIADVPVGNYTVAVKADGYVDSSFSVAVGSTGATVDTKLFQVVDLSTEISTVDQLAALASMSNGTYEEATSLGDMVFTLTEDLDLTGYYWAPIGSGDTGAGFSGSFDGGNHTITGLTVNTSGDYAGLFGEFTSTYAETTEPYIKDLTLVSPVVTGTEYVGAVAGYTYGTVSIDNVTVTGGSVYGTQYTGGVLGYAQSDNTIITNSSNSADVTGVRVGGIVGAQSGQVISCSNSGTITGVGTSAYAGGIIGRGASVDDCVNTGDVYSDGYAGGIAGYSGSYTRNSSNSGDVYLTGSGYAGGLVGYVGYNAIENSYNTGDVTALDADNTSAYAGGLVGYVSGKTIANCYTTGMVTGSTMADGLVGLGYSSYDVSTSYAVDNTTNLTELLATLNTWVADNADNGSYVGWVAGSDDYPEFAPKVTVSGTLTNQYGTAAEGASVTLYSAAGLEVGTAVADASGAYSIENVAMGSYTVQIGGDGYSTPQIAQSFTDDTILNYNVIALEEITPSGSNYSVSTIGQLAWIAVAIDDVDTYNGFYNKTITLMNGLDLSGYYWYPIGGSLEDDRVAFSGSFDGGGYTISGLTISNTEYYQGLFGVIGNPASGYSSYIYSSDYYVSPEIKDLNLANVSIAAESHVGALAGVAEGSTITNITVTGNISATGSYGSAAGLVGALADLYPTDNYDTYISNITVDANVTGVNAAGVVYDAEGGYSTEIVMDTIVMNGSVCAEDYAGGVFGDASGYYNKNTVTVQNVTNYAAVSGAEAGGIFFWATTTNVQNVTNYGTVTATSGDAAGIIYGGTSVSIYNAANFGDVTANSTTTTCAYGIGALHDSSNGGASYLFNSFNQGDITATSVNSVGYVYGLASGLELCLSNNYTTGVLTGDRRYAVAAEYNATNSGQNYYLDDSGEYYLTDDETFALAIDSGSDLLYILNTWVNNNVSSFTTVTLANWQIAAGDTYPTYAIPATLTYDANGATGGSVPDAVTTGLFVGGTATASDNTGSLVKDGYEFAGWSTTATSDTIYKAGETLTLTGEANTLYARWATGIQNATITPAATYVYNTQAQDIAFSVSVDNVALTKDTDYEIISITYEGNEITEVKDAGDYTYTIQGLGLYTGYATVVITVEKVTIEKADIVSTDYTATKVYDGTNAATETFDATIATNVDGLTVAVSAISDYNTSSAGENRTVTLTLGSLVGDDADNYQLDDTLVADGYEYHTAIIEKFVITQVATGTLQFSKTYDGNTSVSGVSGALELQDAAGNVTPTDVTLNYTNAAYNSADAGEDKTVAVTLGDFTTEAASDNYTLALSVTTFTVADCVISAATPILQLPTTPQMKAGNGLSTLESVVVATVTGQNSETPSGTLTFYADADCSTELTNAQVMAWEAGDTVTIYYTFTLDDVQTNAVNANYIDTDVKGSFVLTIVDGDPQVVAFAETAKIATYGDEAFTAVPTVKDSDGNAITDGGAVTYASANTDVATVAADGTVTIVGAGTTTITATAAVVTGEYAEGSGSYTLTVSPKAITVTATSTSREYGASDPTFGFTVTDGVLVSGDDVSDLSVSLSTDATASSVVGGTYSITGTDNDETDNYTVTVTAGSLTITAKQLTWNADGVIAKTYDGTKTVAESEITTTPTLSGVISGDDVTVSAGTVTFDSATVGSTAVTATGYTITGAAAGNYTAPTEQPTFSASIAAADYSVSVPATLEVKVGSGVTAMGAATATVTGVNSETPTGALAFTVGGAALDDDNIGLLEVGATLVVDWAFTLGGDAVNGNYVNTGKTGSITVTIVEGDPQYLAFAEESKSVTYGDAGFANAASVTSTATDVPFGAITYASDDTSVATVDANTGAVTIVGAGTANITATADAVAGTWAQGSASYALTVAPKTPTVADFSITVPSDTQYTGDAVAASVSVASGIAGMGEVTVRYNDEAVAPTNVDSYTVTFDVAAGSNYAAITGLSAGSFSITKADAPALSEMAQSVYYATAQTDVTVDLTKVEGLPTDAGDVTYTLSTTSDDNSILSASAVADGVLTISTNVMADKGQSATITVGVDMGNYTSTTFDVVITTVDKLQTTITGVTVEDKTYDGNSVSYTGTAVGDQDYTGSFTYTWSDGTTVLDAAPVDVGNYTLTVAIPDSDATHMGSVTLDVAISPAALVISPANQSIYNGYDLPTTFTLSYNGLVTGDTIEMVGEAVYTIVDADGEALENSTTNGTYSIVLSDVTFSHSNYTITTADGTLTISTKPSSSTSTSSGSSSSDATVTEGVVVEDVVEDVVEETTTVTTTSPAVDPEEEDTAQEDATPVATPAPTATPEEPTTGDASATTTTETESLASVAVEAATEGTVATASVDEAAMETAVADALAAAAETSTAPVVELAVDMPADAESVSVTLATATLTALAEHPDAALTLTTNVGTITLDSATLTGLVAAADGAEVRMEIAPVATTALNETQQAVVGDAPVYDLSIYLGDAYVANFEGEVTVSLPYTLKEGETADGILVYYLDDMGNIEEMETVYDSLSGQAQFTTSHFSVYVVSHQSVVTSSMPMLPIVGGTVLVFGLAVLVIIIWRKRTNEQED